MKKLTLFLILLQSVIALAQAPQKMAYQSVVRNASNQIVANQNIGVKISIVEGSITGTIVYAETHTTTTNANGLFTLEAGGGTPTTGTFTAINWGNGSHYIKSEIDITGGTNYALSGTMELLSVPYALYAAKSYETTALQAQITALQNTVNSFYPALTTISISLVSGDSASTGVSISSIGVYDPNSSNIGNSGVVWSTSPNPIISYDTKIEMGYLYSGEIPVFLNNLTPNTTYYVRAFATNGFGTSYGNEISFTTVNVPTIVPGNGLNDIDGNNYNTVIIGTQEWTKENLNVSKYRDGTIIPEVTDPEVWRNLTTGAWCYYSNSSINGTTYGKLYNWYAIMGIYNEASLTDISLRKQLSPLGYHIPTESEWITLKNFLGGENVAGGKMKEAGTTHWLSPNIDASNSYGFNALPGGFREFDGVFDSIKTRSSFYCNNNYWVVRNVLSNDSGAAYGFGVPNTYRSAGDSVRCVKD